jgi:hypothetical protein
MCRLFGRPLLEKREKWRTPGCYGDDIKPPLCCFAGQMWATRQLANGAGAASRAVLGRAHLGPAQQVDLDFRRWMVRGL